MKTILYCCGLVSLFIFPQCTKDNTLSPSDPMTVNTFPNTVGDSWIYKVINYQKNTVDTVKVSILGKVKNNFGRDTFTLWQYQWPDKIDSQFVSVINDTVRFYDYQYYNSPHYNQGLLNVYIFPLTANDSLNFNTNNTFFRLREVTMFTSFDISVPQNDSVMIQKSAFHVQKKFLMDVWGQPPAYFIIDDDFVPGIGMVKEEQQYLLGAGSTKVETWILLHFTSLS